jgi:hypothetical protein
MTGMPPPQPHAQPAESGSPSPSPSPLSMPPDEGGRAGSGPRAVALLIGALLTIAFIGYGCLTLVALLSRQHETVQRQFSASAVHAVEIDTDGTGVTLVGGVSSGAQATIGYSMSWSWTHPRLTTTLADNGTLRVVLRCRSTWAPIGCSRRLRLAVPSGASIAATSSGGGITADGINGNVRLESSGGGIRATGLRGSRADVDSSGGGVRLAFVTAPTSVRVSSNGGGVTVQVPPGSGPYAVNSAASGGGNRVQISTDPRASRTVYVRSSGGGIRVEYPGG